ncbi:hypothetical protein CUMW_100100 [Citrus unshiu]|nr:hypothetical protein CUMW_100100 [Citrus unshiu]
MKRGYQGVAPKSFRLKVAMELHRGTIIKHGNTPRKKDHYHQNTAKQHGNKKKIDKKTDSADQEHEETSQSDQAERQEINLAASTSSSDHHAVGSAVNSLFEDISARDFWTQPFVSDSEIDYYSLSGDSCYEDTVDIFGPVMQELQAFDVGFSSS